MNRNIINLVGNTPLIDLGELNGSPVYAKTEYLNPFGSIKDRAALRILLDANLAEGTKIIEAT